MLIPLTLVLFAQGPGRRSRTTSQSSMQMVGCVHACVSDHCYLWQCVCMCLSDWLCFVCSSLQVAAPAPSRNLPHTLEDERGATRQPSSPLRLHPPSLSRPRRTHLKRLCRHTHYVLCPFHTQSHTHRSYFLLLPQWPCG